MKPDAYMPFYGNDFFGAVKSWDAEAKIAYLEAIWHYWNVNHCKGLEDNSESLRRICLVDKADWPRIEAMIFSNTEYFVQDEKFLWRQKRADEEWAKTVIKYAAAVENGKKGGYHAHKR